MSKHVPNKSDKYHQGYYKLQNVDKYIGNPMEVIYRSSWEYKFMLYCDLNKGVIKWGAELFKIPYKDTQGKHLNYIPDFYLETVNKQNPDFINKFLVEIKPEEETFEPEIPLNITEKKYKQLVYKIQTWQKNKAKWIYAIEWAKNRDMIFWLITEKHLASLRP